MYIRWGVGELSIQLYIYTSIQTHGQKLNQTAVRRRRRVTLRKHNIV